MGKLPYENVLTFCSLCLLVSECNDVKTGQRAVAQVENKKNFHLIFFILIVMAETYLIIYKKMINDHFKDIPT